MNLTIRETTPADLEDLLVVVRRAFDSEEEAELVRNLLMDPTADPILSLLAKKDDQPVGHILFTKVVFDPQVDVLGRILAPLAVLPDFQYMGVGGQLIIQGLEILKEQGVDWVFVLGHESYYPRFGFTPAIEQGFEPPYPIPAEFTNAWMAQALTPTCIATYHGRINPPATLGDPRYWRE